METKLEQAYLYDFYGELLNERQRNAYEAFFFQDLSLGEIAVEEGISRQGVHDLVKRSAKTLEEYENKLHLVQKFLFIKEKVGAIQDLAHSYQDKDPQAIGMKIAEIANQILEEL